MHWLPVGNLRLIITAQGQANAIHALFEREAAFGRICSKVGAIPSPKASIPLEVHKPASGQAVCLGWGTKVEETGAVWGRDIFLQSLVAQKGQSSWLPEPVTSEIGPVAN